MGRPTSEGLPISDSGAGRRTETRRPWPRPMDDQGHLLGLLKQVWVGNGRSSRPPQPKSPRVCGLHCATVTAHAPAHPSTARRASGVKPLTAGTPPSSRGRKAHNCSPSGGTGGVSPGRAEAHAEDARSALTRRLARSYLRPDIAPSHRACAVHSRESTSVPSRLSSAAPPLSAEPTGLNPPTPVSGEPIFWAWPTAASTLPLRSGSPTRHGRATTP